MTVERCVLVDSDARRRDLVCQRLRETSVEVEQFSWAREIDPERLEDAILLVFDQGQSVLSTVKLLVENLAGNSIIAYSAEPEIDRVVRTVKAGVESYLVWPFTTEQFLQAVNQIEIHTPMTVGNERIEAEAKQLIKQLTPREREILSGVIHGLSNQQIGEALGISARTVEIHRANMIKKLGAKNSAAAVKIALDAGFNDAAPSPNSNGDWIGEAA